MTTLERLAIQGIRSYGPSETDQQVIGFKPPLTLILGSNGSGKTTIIEALRMACTGALPPNANRGASFVHDPKLSRATETKGKIMLRFLTSQGETLTVTRSFQLTNKKGDKQTFQQLEGNIKIGTGKDSTTASKRCLDMDNIVPSLMGVSKAVLENVIFCHQEESNWVLGEPKILKDKFDNIFASSRYSKALEAIKKLQSEQKLKIKDLEGSEKELKLHREHAHKKRLEKKGSEEEYSQKEEATKKHQEELDKKKEHLRRCDNELLKCQENKIAREKNDEKIVIWESEAQKKKDAIGEDFYSESTEELMETLLEMESLTHDSDRKESVLKKDKLESQRKQGGLRDRIEKLRSEESNLHAEQAQNKTSSGERDRIAVKLVLKYKDKVDIDEERAKTQLHKAPSELSNKLEVAIKNQEQRQKAERDDHRKALDHENMELMTARTAHQVEAQNKNDCEKRVQESEKKVKELESTGRGGVTLEQAMAKKEEAEVEFTDFTASGKTEQVERELEKLVLKEKELDFEKKGKKDLLTQAKKQQQGTLRLEANERAFEEKKAAFETFLDQESEKVARLGQGVPGADEILQLWDDYLKRTKQQSTQAAHKASQRYVAVQTLKASVKNAAGQLEALRAEQQRLKKSAGSVRVDGKLVLEGDIVSSISTLEDRLEIFAKGNSTKMLFTSYQKFAKRDGCCALCRRGFTSEFTSEDFDKLVGDMVEKMPSSSEEDTDKVKAHISELRAAEVDAKKAVEKEEEVSKCEEDLRREEQNLEEDEGLYQTLERSKEDASNEYEEASRVKSQLVELDLPGMERLRAEIEGARKHSPGGEDSVSAAALELQIDNLDKELDEVRRSKSEQEKMLNDLKFLSSNLQKKMGDANHEVIFLKGKRENLESEQRALTSLKAQLNTSVEQLPKLREAKRAQDAKTAALRDAQTIAEEKTEMEGQGLRRDLGELQSVEKRIIAYQKKGVDENLGEKKEECSAKVEELKTEEKQCQKFSDELDRLTSSLEQTKTTIRQLQDNLDLRKIEKSLDELNDQNKDYEDELRNAPDTKQIREMRVKLEAETEKLKTQVDTKQGQMQNLRATIEKLKADLAGKEYHNIDQRYTVANIELITTRNANKDLDKYYIALDKALMRYHEIKMDEINKIVKEYWQITYQGNDIETIQIKADLETAANRRSHNYRLVMRQKNSSELDMRGRCSAGQKVLASLVVRMALAETFCHNCGILALDEPTSNLDAKNIEGFTGALARIVNDRRGASSSFQLLVISHDTDFINELARETGISSYYRIKKDLTSQTSRINEYNVTEM